MSLGEIRSHVPWGQHVSKILVQRVVSSANPMEVQPSSHGDITVPANAVIFLHADGFETRRLSFANQWLTQLVSKFPPEKYFLAR